MNNFKNIYKQLVEDLASKKVLSKSKDGIFNELISDILNSFPDSSPNYWMNHLGKIIINSIAYGYSFSNENFKHLGEFYK